MSAVAPPCRLCDFTTICDTMRPNLLNPLFASLSTLPGVGPKLEKLFGRLLGREDEPRA